MSKTSVRGEWHHRVSVVGMSSIAAALFALVLVACDSDGSSNGDDCTDCTDSGRERDVTDDGSVGGCTSSDECRSGSVCDPTVNLCVPRCDGINDCGPTETCELATGLCTPRTECTQDEQCATDELCDTCLGVCVPSTGGAYCREDANCPSFEEFCDICVSECREPYPLCAPCNDDRQCGGSDDQCLAFATGGQFCGIACGAGLPACPIGSTCSADHSQCVPLTGNCLEQTRCDEDEDCLGVQICAATGLCIDGCATDEACPSNAVCSAGRCAPPCTVDEECDEGVECVDGHCRIPGGCTTSFECLEPETYCDRTVGMCVSGCEVDEDCFTATKECVDGECVRRACRANYACAFGQICDFDTGECREPDEPHCSTCDSSDMDSCGTENICLDLQDEDGNSYGEFCWIACADDPLNQCPAGFQCTEIEITGSGTSEVRNVCARRCDINPV